MHVPIRDVLGESFIWSMKEGLNDIRRAWRAGTQSETDDGSSERVIQEDQYYAPASTASKNSVISVHKAAIGYFGPAYNAHEPSNYVEKSG